MKRKLRIRVTRICNQPADLRAYCRICGCETELITAINAGEILQIGSDALLSLLNAGIIHGIPTVTGSVCICKRSMFEKNGFT